MKCWLIIIKYIGIFVFAIFSLYATQPQIHVQLFFMLIKHIDKETARNTDRQTERERERALPVWMEVVKQLVNASLFSFSRSCNTSLIHVTNTRLHSHTDTPRLTLSAAHTERIHMNTQPLSSSAAPTARLHDSCSTAVFFNHQLNTYSINAFLLMCV